MTETWRTRKIRWEAVLAAALAVCALFLLLFIGQSRDMKMLEEKRAYLREAQLELQNKRNEKTRELSLADTPEYLAERARENGYLLPGEIRFVITNLDELIENGGDAEAEVAEEGV